MAGALGVQLGGDARYDGVTTARPTFGDGRAPRPPTWRAAFASIAGPAPCSG
jgi:cobalamin biosynthesis protein CobD/CbiB